MNALKEIQTAIDTLTKLRDAASPGEWSASWRGQEYVVGFGENGEVASGLYSGGPSESDTTDFDLIVTLHRAIDAQLAILRGELNFCRINGFSPSGNKLDLARAINGKAI